MAKKPMDEATKKRLRAARMLKAGKGPAEVALAVGVARQTVYTWNRLLDEGGIDALRAVPGRGRPARLDAQQLAQLRQALLHNPTEHGFGTELWTLKRVGMLIKRMYGVEFGQTQIWRFLGTLGFSAQKPERRAIERNEEAVRHWKQHTWPALKKSQARRPTDRLYRRDRHQRAADASAYLGAEGANAGYPVSFQLEACSAIAGLSRTNYLFRFYEGSVKKEQVVEFLKALKAHLRQPLLIIWDGARPHHAAIVRQYLDSLEGHIQITFLPPYCPELNPVEYLRAWLKRHAIANFCPDNLDELQTVARNKLKSAQHRPSIIAACWIQATLW